VVTFDAHAAGTAPEVWKADGRMAAAAELDLTGLRDLVVIAAHPDDETLGAGGLMALAAHRGVPVHVVVVTDGAGSHPLSPTVSREELAGRRVAELREAITRSVPGARLTWLGFPDGHAEEFAREIELALRVLFSEVGTPSHLATVWSGDGHADHETIGRIVESVVPPGTILLSYPVWMWHWARPESSAVPWSDIRSLPLPPGLVELKRHAIAAFVSQIAPLSSAAGDERVLEAGVLAHFESDRESYFVHERSR
jgi:LmbE family N-acetylglucosaminyl deacetylase